MSCRILPLLGFFPLALLLMGRVAVAEEESPQPECLGLAVFEEREEGEGKPRVIVIREGGGESKPRVVVIGEGGEGKPKNDAAEKQMRERLEQLRKALTERAAAAAPGAPANPGQPLAGSGAGVYRPQPGQPGAIMMAPAAPQIAGLPDDMQVTIEKRGSQPARITVTQGDKMWRTTEKELEMLPGPARAYASRVLGRPAAVGWMQHPGMPGMPAQPEGLRFQLKLDEKGRLQAPAAQPGASIKQLPGGGIQFEIREGAEAKPGSPWQELKRPEPQIRRLEAKEIELKAREVKPAEKPAEAKPENKEQREEIERLRKAIQELRKALESRQEK